MAEAIDNIRIDKDDTEHRILCFIREEVESFRKRTGIRVKGASFSLKEEGFLEYDTGMYDPILRYDEHSEINIEL